MSGFRKAKAEQAALKMGIYGPTGSGKTFTALLLAEGLAKVTGKRVAFVDTERGTDFYAKHVPDRQVHPEAFDFDALYTRSLTEVVQECKRLSAAEYGCVVIDSITHLWEAAIAAYKGGKTSAGTIPMHAWGTIKRPYKELMHFLINSPLHAFILGRQGNEWAESEETGELVNVGYKMKAEGETAYEPHVLIRMEAVKPAPSKGKKPDRHALAVPCAFVEKDRSGILFGRRVEWPAFDSIAAPLLRILGDTQANVQSEEEAGIQDAEALSRTEREKAGESSRLRTNLEGKFLLCKTQKEVEALSKGITPEVKKLMAAGDLEAVRSAYVAALDRVRQQPVAANGEA